MKKRIKIAIPYNIVCKGGTCLGFDAGFWFAVSRLAMRIALIRKESDLKQSLKDYDVLVKPVVDANRQLEDLRMLMNAYKPKLRFSLLTSILRLFIGGGKSPIEVEYFTEAAAAAICKAAGIDKMQPVNRVKWFCLEVDVEMPLPTQIKVKKIHDKNYRNLYEADELFKKALEFVVAAHVLNDLGEVSVTLTPGG